jgi:hypothetical protein
LGIQLARHLKDRHGQAWEAEREQSA